MSIPLFNLIAVNERALLGTSFHYFADRYMENIIQHGAIRCYVFQWTALVTGILLLLAGPLGIEALWANWVVLTKVLLLFILMILLSYVHFKLQPKIEALIATVSSDANVPEGLFGELKPHRILRKRLASLCLFIVITTIVVGLQVYQAFSPVLTIVLIGMAALFSWRVNKTLIRFGWI
ncbi:MAG: hypothetical protein HYW57_01670 [Ignavibacteriales bacterium]|nr:hypothetical protein [Ignavibacteriales bacterium]